MSKDQFTTLLSGEESAEGSVTALAQGVSAKPKTILLVEDDQMVRTLAKHVLELIGYNVLEAGSGLEAIEICKQYDDEIAVLLTDVVMPQMSGPQLSKELTSVWPGIGTLYMSGYNDDMIMRHGVLDKGVRFLQKPFTPDALALKVGEILADLELVRVQAVIKSKGESVAGSELG